ncbi:glycoside hydrolase family 43 protein [Streptomyces sp. NBC_00344]|uniref:glycoside hydrolase family 43 protein n=1 Tax=Streptomyces sp. NBC_00344 TaxID=2975720 RepID=UPI002E1D9EB2
MRRFVFPGRSALTLLLAGLLALCGVVALPRQAHAVGGTFRNPLGTRADPYMTYYQGNYYLAATEGDAVRIAKAPTLGGLLTAPRTTVWQDTDSTRDRQVWAPSFYLMDGHWYIYYTADDGVDEHHRLYVVESAGADPLGPYHFKAKLEAPDAQGLWAIDPVVLHQNGRLYMVWSGAGSEGHNLIYLAPMSNPWTISGNRVYLPSAGGCPEVREAPSILQHSGKTFLVYSTCDTGKPDYQLWMQSISDTADPLRPANWVQHSGAVFARSDAAGVWGPGSNGFFTSPDGTQDWIVYHAKNTSAFTYDGRTTRAQKIGWNDDGTPHLGSPAAAGATQDLPSGDPGGGPFWINDTNSSSGAGSVAYTGAWNSGSGCGSQCFWSDDHWSNQPGATATWTFTGTRIALLSVRDTGNGIAAFSVDGGAEQTGDYFGPIRMGEQLNYVSPVLPFGTHTLRLRVTGDHSPSSSGAYISVDRAEISTR